MESSYIRNTRRWRHEQRGIEIICCSIFYWYTMSVPTQKLYEQCFILIFVKLKLHRTAKHVP